MNGYIITYTDGSCIYDTFLALPQYSEEDVEAFFLSKFYRKNKSLVKISVLDVKRSTYIDWSNIGNVKIDE